MQRLSQSMGGRFLVRLIGSDGMDYTSIHATLGEAWRHTPAARFVLPKPWIRQLYKFEHVDRPARFVEERYDV